MPLSSMESKVFLKIYLLLIVYVCQVHASAGSCRDQEGKLEPQS